jgi:flagellar biosynthesis/type III secretory pathway M-ring protein FliF/YscJ
MAYVIVLAVLAVAVFVISAPLRAQRARRDPEAEAAARLDELEAARDAKYEEIRDAEMDHATGKLSEGDYRAIDTTLRAEAVEILHALDRASEAS